MLPVAAVGLGLVHSQLTFFEEQKNPVVEELLGVNVNLLTPLEALNLVSSLQAKAKAVRG